MASAQEIGGTLNVADNALNSDLALEELALLVKKFTPRELIFRNCCLTAEGLQVVIEQAILRNYSDANTDNFSNRSLSLEILSLSGNEIGGEGIALLNDLISSHSDILIETIDLFRTSSSDSADASYYRQGIKELIDLFDASPVLRSLCGCQASKPTLDILQPPTHPAEYELVAADLRKNTDLRSLTIQLDLADTGIQGIQGKSNTSKSNTSKSKLKGRRRRGSKSSKEKGDSSKDSSTYTTMDLDQEQSICEMLRALARNQTLVRCKLFNVPLPTPPSILKALQDGLNKNLTLRTLEITFVTDTAATVTHIHTPSSTSYISDSRSTTHTTTGSSYNIEESLNSIIKACESTVLTTLCLGTVHIPSISFLIYPLFPFIYPFHRPIPLYTLSIVSSTLLLTRYRLHHADVIHNNRQHVVSSI